MAELNPEYIAKMEDVLSIYEKPLDVAEPVVCIYKKPVSLHDDVRPGVRAEIEISLFSRGCLGSRRIPTLKLLHRQAKAWNRRTNRARVKINWKFDRKAARKKFGYKYSFKRSEN